MLEPQELKNYGWEPVEEFCFNNVRLHWRGQRVLAEGPRIVEEPRSEAELIERLGKRLTKPYPNPPFWPGWAGRRGRRLSSRPSDATGPATNDDDDPGPASPRPLSLSVHDGIRRLPEDVSRRTAGWARSLSRATAAAGFRPSPWTRMVTGASL